MESLNTIEQILSALTAVALSWLIITTATKKRRNRTVTLKNTSVLFSYYSEGMDLTNVYSGRLKNKLRYTALLATSNMALVGDQNSAVLYKVILPFATTVHLLGIPRNTNAAQLNPAQNGSIMERVSLEGNYDDVFTLFAEKGMQTESRYVLDPKAMVFTIDFCQSQNWEIVGNELYFVVANSMEPDPNDKTQILEDVIPFIEQIRPSVERPLTPKELRMITPYGADYRKDIQCPLCEKVMHCEDVYYHCPQGHGVLLSGGQLGQLVSGKLQPKLKDSKPLQYTKTLHCPSCKSPMAKVPYGGGDMIIDSCTQCAYRWLDAGEYTKN